jgi:hypothetical protein
MSTKTLRKRIALVAVTALGAGLLSVAPASAAVSSIAPDDVVYSASSSVGVCAFGTEDTDSSGTNDSTENGLQVGEVQVGGTLAFTMTSAGTAHGLTAALDSMSITVTGPAQIATHTPNGSTPAARSFGAGMKSVTLTGDGTNGHPGTAFTVSVTGAGAVQIAVTTTASGASATTIELYTFTATATCATGVASPAYSFVQVTAYDTIASASLPTSNTTVATAATDSSVAESAAKIANGGIAWIGIRVRDAVTPANVTTQGIFSASATNGAVVSYSDSSALQSSSATAAGPVTGNAQFENLSVYQGLANKDKPLTTVVSVFFNGVLFGTRTITFTGKATKLEIDSANAGVGKAANANTVVASYELTDAAGNNLTSEGPGITGISGDAGAVTNVPLLVPSTGGTVVDPTQAIVTAAASDISTEASGYNGYFGWTCGSGSGTAKIYLKYTFSDLSSLTSNTHDAACAYTAVNYKASLDKASYAPGEIATLTITATDKNGKPVYDADENGDGVDLGDNVAETPAISLPQLTAVSAATFSDSFSSGKKTYKFTVGSTEGSFSGVVDLKSYNGTTYSQVAQTVSYKVASTSTAVSMADVLKAIVSLIASINKQIAALQKALLKK